MADISCFGYLDRESNIPCRLLLPATRAKTHIGS